MSDAQKEHMRLDSVNRKRNIILTGLWYKSIDQMSIESLRASLYNLFNVQKESLTEIEMFYPIHLGTVDRIRTIHSKLKQLPNQRLSPCLNVQSENEIAKIISSHRDIHDTAGDVLNNRVSTLESLREAHCEVVDSLKQMDAFFPNQCIDYIKNIRYLAQIEIQLVKQKHKR